MRKERKFACAMKWLLVIVGIIQLGCGQQPSTTENASSNEEVKKLSYDEYLIQGQQASSQTQAVLLANIGAATQQGGTEYAVQFCNLNAMPIVDSLSQAVGMKIGRISSRARNPDNKISSEEDKRAWTYFANSLGAIASADTVLYDRAKKAVYYKQIRLGMETCLQCHGSRSQDIELATLEKIDELYPTDSAVNYSMGELRGLWKIEFK